MSYTYKNISYENYINLSSFLKSTSFDYCISLLLEELLLLLKMFIKMYLRIILIWNKWVLVIWDIWSYFIQIRFFYCEDKIILSYLKFFLLKLGVSSQKLNEKIFQSFR